jgi:YidC/Oxa1 family membrane protein insertase
VFDLIASVLAWFYDLVPSYGVAIVLLTLTVMVILTPLTLKGTRSMIAMQRLQPEMRKLQAQYKDDRQKLNEELLKFYKEHKINPVGGCLPLLLQMPVFIVLYRVISGLTKTSGIGSTVGSVLAGGPLRNTFQPSYLDHGSALYQALSNDTEMRSFGINLADSASRALSDGGFVHALPLLVLIVLVAATSYIQQKQVSGRNPNAQINPQQQMLLRVMPGFFAFISLGLPGGVVLYFFVSNLYRMAQQAFITRTMYRDGTMAIDVPSKEIAKGGGAAKSTTPAKAPKAAKPATTTKAKALEKAAPAKTAKAKPAATTTRSGSTSANGAPARTPRFGRVTGNGGTTPAARPAPKPASRQDGNGRAQPAATPPRPRKKKRK